MSGTTQGRVAAPGGLPPSRSVQTAVGNVADGRSGPGNVAGARDIIPVTEPGPTEEVAFNSGHVQYAIEETWTASVSNITGPAGTISFWLQPGWEEGSHDEASLVELGDGRLQVVKKADSLSFEFSDDAGKPGGLGVPIGEWKQGEWHQIAAAWDGNVYTLYVDGRLVSQQVHDGHVDLAEDTTLFVGDAFGSQPKAQGVIAALDLRNRSLGPGEVARSFNLVVDGNGAEASTGR